MVKLDPVYMFRQVTKEFFGLEKKVNSYRLNERNYEIHSSMGCIGENEIFTAMAKTVGIPVAIMSRLILEDQISARGVMIPDQEEVYSACLKELEEHGIKFSEKEVEPSFY